MQIKLIKQALFTQQDAPCDLLGGAKLAFRQGDLDGACGPYAAMTAMVAAGLISRQEAIDAWQYSPDRRTKFGKVLDGISALAQDGTDSAQVIELIKGVEKFVRGKITCTPWSSWPTEKHDPLVKGRSLIPLIRSALDDQDLPVILRLAWQGEGAHWVVAVGYASDPFGKSDSILVIDPGCDITRTQLWNAILSASPVKNGPKPYMYWSGTGADRDSCCQIEEAIFFI